MIFSKKTTYIFILIVFLLGGFFYFRSGVYHSTGSLDGNKSFEIVKGESNAEIADNLKLAGLITHKIYFYYYLKANNLVSKIMPGVYDLSGNMTIPEIVYLITNEKESFVKITFPEGWTAEKMAERLNNNNLPGDRFLEIVNNPGNFKKRYSYLSGEEVQTLEGYLFPDTYYFKKDISAENIVGRLLDTFDQRLSNKMREEIERQGKTIAEIVTMASIVEREVQTEKDMQIVAGIFWKRIKIGQRLQSDAPLSYILKDNEDSHNAEDLALDSLYNTYRYDGLPPGPIGNPGLTAIQAAIYPQDSAYLYFLTAKVGERSQVIFSQTFEEHVANKYKYGL